MIVNLDGTNFGGQASSCAGRSPRNLNWDHTCSQLGSTVHIDRRIWSKRGHAPHYAWILETPETTRELETWLQTRQVQDKYGYEFFSKVFTHSTRLVKACPNAVWIPASGVWVQEIGAHPKSKRISMITSPKAHLPGHRVRLGWAERLKAHVDLFGLHHRIEKKEEGLKDYCFSVAIENAIAPGYFTEKILDCFATGTVPVYSGAPDISGFFNPAGIILLDQLKDWSRLTQDRYEAMMPAVLDNLARVQGYLVPEDRMEEHLITQSVT